MALNFHRVHDWISCENQGGKIAAFDIDQDGEPEFLVLRIDHPVAGPNAGFYRVGKNLAGDNSIAAWGPWIQIPDWTSAENQGGGIWRSRAEVIAGSQTLRVECYRIVIAVWRVEDSCSFSRGRMWPLGHDDCRTARAYGVIVSASRLGGQSNLRRLVLDARQRYLAALDETLLGKEFPAYQHDRGRSRPS